MPMATIQSESPRVSNLSGARPGSGAPKGNGNALKHGLNQMKQPITKLGSAGWTAMS
jgi:hypothetical protein